MNAYVETQGQVDRIYLKKIKEAKRRIVVSQQVICEGRFTVNGTKHSFSGIDRVLYHNNEAEAASTIDELRRTRRQTALLFDPQNPRNHVLHPEFLPGAFKVCLMGLLGLLILLVAVAMVVLGGNLLISFGLPANMPAGPQVPPPIGDPMRDYYSGALDAHAWKKWEGYRSQIFLMPDRTLIVIHDESTHHRAERWSLSEALAGKAGIHFDESQESAKDEFFNLIRFENAESN